MGMHYGKELSYGGFYGLKTVFYGTFYGLKAGVLWAEGGCPMG